MMSFSEQSTATLSTELPPEHRESKKKAQRFFSAVSLLFGERVSDIFNLCCRLYPAIVLQTLSAPSVHLLQKKQQYAEIHGQTEMAQQFYIEQQTVLSQSFSDTAVFLILGWHEKKDIVRSIRPLRTLANTYGLSEWEYRISPPDQFQTKENLDWLGVVWLLHFTGIIPAPQPPASEPSIIKQ